MQKAILAWVMLVLMVPGQGWAAAITLNATGTTNNQLTAVSSPQTDASLTIASGSDRYLVCVIADRDNPMPDVAMTWNGVAMTLSNSQKQDTWDEYIYIFTLNDPDTGAQTASLSWTGGGTRRFAWRCVAFDNVDSVSGTLTNNSGTSADPTETITTASGDVTVTGWTHSGTTTGASWPGSGFTSLFSDAGHGSAKYALSTDTDDAHQFPYDEVSANWGVAGIRLLQTGAGASTPRTLTLMGVGQ